MNKFKYIKSYEIVGKFYGVYQFHWNSNLKELVMTDGKPFSEMEFNLRQRLFADFVKLSETLQFILEED